MEDWDKINAVNRVQEFIELHIDEEMTMETLSKVADYSLWHTLRIFKELTNKTPFEFIRAIRLTKTAQKLRDTKDKVLDIGMDFGFNSHDGFTRAFSRQFGITPQKYRKETPPLNYFTYTPILYYHLYVKNRRNDEMEKRKVSGTVTTTVVERSARKLMLLRSKKATDYFSFCEEMGCEWHGILNSVLEKFETSALITLPIHLVKDGTSSTAAGIELPFEYAKQLPHGYELIDLPPCKMLYFQGMPFENESDFGEAIGIVFEAIANYKPEMYGFSYTYDIAPHFNFGAAAETGAKMAVPIKCIKQA